MNLVLDIYKETEKFPKSELFGLVSQMRRCAVSIPSNIAEGCVKHSDKETLRFLDMALGSVSELETQMIISEKLEYSSNEELISSISNVKALIMGLIKYYEKQVKNLVP